MANKVYIDVIIDDKGTTQRVAVSAKKLGIALQGVGAGAGQTDRQIKGLGAQSSNSTKNFAKMTQGLTGSGGLVQAYAILATQIFAISAAFNFLKSAGTLVTLQAGQVAYAGATGIALRTLTNDIIAATDAQISFQDASQAAAIGVSSGLRPEQLVALGKAAKDASYILGRDVTDSFNRLVRGVTKAEPELLDELGIILRLDTASENYATTLGKKAKNLTIFEKSQAVVNDVLAQAEDKYGRIMDILNPQVNPFAQLGIAFDNILNNIKEMAAYILGPLAKVFTDVPLLGVAFFGLFAKGILTAMIPALGNLGESAKAAYMKYAESAAYAMEAERNLVAQQTITNRSMKAQYAAGMASQMQGMTFNPGGAFEKMQAGKGADLSNRELAGMKSALNKQTGMFATMNATIKAGWINLINSMMLANKSLDTSVGVTTATITTRFQAMMISIKLGWASLMTSMASLAVGAAALINKAFFWLAIISTAITLFKVVMDKFFPAAPLTDAEKAAKALSERMTSLSEEFVSFTQIQNILNENTERATSYLADFGKRINSLGVEEATMALREYAAAQEAYNASLAKGPGFLPIFLGGFMGMTPQDIRDEFESTLSTLNFEKYVEKSGTDQQKATLAYFKNEVEAFKNSTEERAKNSVAFSSYIGTVEKFLETGKNELIPQLLREKVAVQEITQTYAELARQQTENTKVAKDIFSKYIPDTEFDRAVTSLNIELKALQETVAKDLLGNSKAELERISAINTQIDLINELGTAEHTLAMIKEKNSAADIRASIGRTTGQKIGIEQANKMRDIGIEQAELLRQQAEIEKVLKQKKGEEYNAALRQQEVNIAKLDTLKAQSEELARQADYGYQIYDAANQALETGLQTSISSIIKGEESSIKDAMLNIAQGMLGAVADTMSKRITNMIMGTDPIQVARKQGQVIASSFISAGQVVATAISQAVLGKPVPATAGGEFLGGATAMLPAGVGKVGGAVNFIKDLFGYANGGMISGGFRAFANGGTVTSPTLGLIGEGKYNEAVVPLPNGKSIPVQMNGAGQNNNVTVNVAIDNQGNASSTNTMQDSQQAGNMGALIARAVQQELQNQKRSGGILNPYGVA